MQGKHGNHVRGANHPKWNGGKTNYNGYPYTRMPKHHRAGKHGYVPDHVLVVEKVIGKPLPPKSVIHHIDGNKLNNNINNFVLCENESYHQIIHQRERALSACGNSHWIRCLFCHKYDDPINMYIRSKPYRGAYHKNCYNEYRKAKYKLDGAK